MYRRSIPRYRAYYDPQIDGGPITGWNAWNARKVGGTPRVMPIFTDFQHMQPERPVRAFACEKANKLPPVLYHRQDQIMELHNALQKTRKKNQLKNAMNQLNLAARNADVYIKDIIMKDKRGHRPSIHEMMFLPGGLNEKQHILSCIPTHQLIPILSLITHDFEEGKITLLEATEVVHALADSTVGHSKAVQRELFNQYIRCCALDENTEKAVHALREMKAKNIRRNHVTYAPLFRLARKNNDADFHIALTDIACDLEGGMMGKLFRVDIPRIFSVGLVFIRFWWRQICTILLVTGGFFSAVFMAWMGLA